MNSVEFTRFLNELRDEYGLPPLTLTDETIDPEEFLTKENLPSLRQHDDMHT